MKKWWKRTGAALVGLGVFAGVLVAAPQPALAVSYADCYPSNNVTRTNLVYVTNGYLYWGVHADRYASGNWYIRRYVTGYYPDDPTITSGYINGNNGPRDENGRVWVPTGSYYMTIVCYGPTHTKGFVG